MALLGDGGLRAWGHNLYGERGHVQRVFRDERTLERISSVCLPLRCAASPQWF